MISSNILMNIFMQVFGVCKSYNYITHLSTHTPSRSRANHRLVDAYGRKTVRAFCFFFEYCSLSWGWGGVGWGGMLTFLVLRTWYIAMLLRSLGSFTTLRVATLLRSLVWVGVGVGLGWGGMLTFLVLRTWYIAMLLRSLGSFTTWHVATLLRSLWSFTTLQVATLLRSLGSFTTWHVATLLRSLWSFTTLQVATRLVSPRSFTTLHVATLLRSLWSFTTLHVAALRMGLGAVVMHRFSVCRQRQGRTKMSCYTCVAGSGVMSAIMATCCRRQLPHWWIAEPTKSVKKNLRIHVWCTWCLPGFVKNQ